MSSPSDDRPTTVIPQQTVEQPAVTTAPATRRNRVWQRKLPSRVGRARTSTVIIGLLFVLLSALNSVLPQDEGASVPVVLPSGQTAYVNESDLPSGAVPSTAAPATTTRAPAPTSTPATTSRAPQSTASAPSTTPSETSRAPVQSSTPSSTTSRATTTSRDPSTSAEPSSTAARSTASSAPTS
jgi:hypothetical protein